MGSASNSAPRTYLQRLRAHLLTPRRVVDRALPEPALDRLEHLVGQAEAGTSAQLRLVVEARWPLAHVRWQSPRARALDWFSQLRVWDTEHNNGVLIYLLFAEHDVEILADRGYNGRVTAAAWEAICRRMEHRFAAGDFEAGIALGVQAIGELMRECFPSDEARNEQPDRPLIR